MYGAITDVADGAGVNLSDYGSLCRCRWKSLFPGGFFWGGGAGAGGAGAGNMGANPMKATSDHR